MSPADAMIWIAVGAALELAIIANAPKQALILLFDTWGDPVAKLSVVMLAILFVAAFVTTRAL